MTTTEGIIHSLRWIAGATLAGTVLFGAFLSWVPALASVASELGAIVGVGAGVMTAVRSHKHA